MQWCFRTVVGGSVESSEQLHSILIDSGADASIFPVSLLGLGKKADGVIGRLCDDSRYGDLPEGHFKKVDSFA